MALLMHKRASTVQINRSRDRMVVCARASATRRALLTVPICLPLMDAAWAHAGGADFKKFLGYSAAPDLYLGYGQKTDSRVADPPLYSFEYPADWTEEIPTKTAKSTMGMDGLVMHPKTRKELAYVVALGGKDYRDSVLKDARSSLIVFAGSDPDLRQAVSDGKVEQATRRVNGNDLYMFDIASDKRRYLSTIGKKGDTIFALVVTAPSKAFEQDYAALKHIQDTFQLL
eukprot:GHRQ01006811.1.p2 GENE.GHRQ01006811.1~~GHRQ01006811.1.p2  ORF type:complete len:229 (+),score=54.83 GHRQ01006811.1:261-947(+)